MKDEKINVLQVGTTNWKRELTIPENIEWFYISPQNVEMFSKTYRLQEAFKRRAIHAVLLTDDFYDESILSLGGLFEPYSLLYSTGIGPNSVSDSVRRFLIAQMAYPVSMDNPNELVDVLSHTFFEKQYGDKFHTKDLIVSTSFKGKIGFDGSAYLTLEGHFGEEFRQIANYAYNIPKDEVPLEFWPEFIKEGPCELQYKLQIIPLGGTKILSEIVVSEAELNKPFYLRDKQEGYLHLSIFAKGEGKLKLGPTHYRFSRYHFGTLLLGGNVHATSKRQEFLHYLHPGDFTPPLNVYFSGYRTAEGFEGYWMMKSLNKPFLLIADPRLEGGSFYIGDQEYEDAIKQVIQDALDFLGFEASQMIMSGLSMGTYGALYYGLDFKPHAIVVGKPLVNLGKLAENEKTIRPNIFPTSLDLLKQYANDLSERSRQDLDNRFWTKFEDADLSHTQLRIAYMKNDDYDRTAFYDLLEKTRSSGTKLVGKGWVGRHNDNSGAITQWFISQFRSLIRLDFSKEKHEQ